MQPLVLLAGMNCTADLWAGCGVDDAITPQLTARSVDAQVDLLLSELPPTFVLGGLSLGAIVAMAIIARAPERVSGLCVVSTNAKAPTALQQESWHGWLDQLDGGAAPRDLQKQIIGSLLTPAVAASRPDLVERTLRMGDETGASALRAQLQMQTTRVDLRPGLARVAAPTLVVSGADDAICPPSFHTEIAAAVPGARMVTLEGGHLLPLERPDAFGALVRSWRPR
ncbi:alpha/beta fold hydrolase [Microbacterium sp. P03]|uniref:alpha/beta fold hydrolase n=1 Tax=Microbacterium sp. P03 TaxID=3366946 RepID=UPI0037476CC9